MANSIEVSVPDIGGFKNVDVIDVLVKNGQQVEKETPLITLETEKASMDVPSPMAGRVADVKLKVGDKVSEGSLILTLESSGSSAADARAGHGRTAGRIRICQCGRSRGFPAARTRACAAESRCDPAPALPCGRGRRKRSEPPRRSTNRPSPRPMPVLP